jgi:hypothetical protein
MAEIVNPTLTAALNFNIAGVSVQSKLSELTVSQFVELITHVSSTQPALRATPDAATMAAAVEQVRNVIAQQAKGQPYYEILKSTQEQILGYVPTSPATVQATGGHDAGPSPLKK